MTAIHGGHVQRKQATCDQHMIHSQRDVFCLDTETSLHRDTQLSSNSQMQQTVIYRAEHRPADSWVLSFKLPCAQHYSVLS